MRKKALIAELQKLRMRCMLLQDENLQLRIGQVAPGVGAAPVPVPLPPSASRFPQLRALDALAMQNPQPPEPLQNPEGRLATLAKHMRAHAATHANFYADFSLFAAWLCAMAASDFLLLLPQTPEQSPLPFLQATASALEAVFSPFAVQPSWQSPADLFGAQDPATRQYSTTPVLESIYAACQTERIALLTLSELAVAPLAPFAPLLSLHQRQGSGRLLPLCVGAWPEDPVHLHDGALPWPSTLWLCATQSAPVAFDPTLFQSALPFRLPDRSEAAPFLVQLQQTTRLSALGLRFCFDYAEQTEDIPAPLLQAVAQLQTFLGKRLGQHMPAAADAQLRRFVSTGMACGQTPTAALDSFFYHTGFAALQPIVKPAVWQREQPALLRYVRSMLGTDALPQTTAWLGA